MSRSLHGIAAPAIKSLIFVVVTLLATVATFRLASRLLTRDGHTP